MEQRFWQERYELKETRFDLGGPSAPFVAWLDRTFPQGAPAGAQAVVPGCGRGYDVLELARRGFLATGIDFAPTAIHDGREAAERAGLSERARFLEQDLFV